MLTTLFVLWLYVPTTKGMEWHADIASDSKMRCEQMADIRKANEGGKGPAESGSV